MRGRVYSFLCFLLSVTLQLKNLLVMDLHPKVKGAEKQVVMACMENNLANFDLDFGKVGRALRRRKHFSNFFAKAVEGQIVANSAGRTPGLYKTKVGCDWDCTYKKKTQFIWKRYWSATGS